MIKRVLSVLFTLLLIFSFTAKSETIASIDSLITMLQSSKEDTAKVNLLVALSQTLLNETGDFQKSGSYGRESLALAAKLNDKKGIANSMMNIAISYHHTKNYDTAISYNKKALAILENLNDKSKQAECFMHLAQNYSGKGKLDSTFYYLRIGIELKHKIGDKKGVSDGFNIMGNIFLTLEKYNEALRFFSKSLKIKEKINDRAGIGLVYNNIGNVKYQQLKYDEALTFYMKAANYKKEITGLINIGNIYANIGKVLTIKNKLREALDYFIKTSKLYEKINYTAGIATTGNYIGAIYIKLANPELALVYYKKSFTIFKQIENKKGIAESLTGIGKAYKTANNYSKALDYFKQALLLSKTINSEEAALSDLYLELASTFEHNRDYENSLKYTELYNTIKDSLLHNENSKQISDLNNRYETDKKEKEIQLLSKDQQLSSKIIKQQYMVRWGLIGGMGLLSLSIITVYKRYRFKKKANTLLEKQKEEIYKQNILITDSIDYAQTIQEAMLPSIQEIQQLFPDSFTFYKPKSVVSGDFFWINKNNDQYVCAVADCTGHGVPGAFMSLLGFNMLENIAKGNKALNPAAILNTLNHEILVRLSTTEENSKHGMDITLITINPATNELCFSAAHNSLYIIREGNIIELKADRMGIGGSNSKQITFSNQSFQLKKGDMLYLFTDGFPDQMGGPNRKKFYYSPFKKLLASVSHLSSKEQKEKLDTAHKQWMGDYDQTDDILIMGIRIS